MACGILVPRPGIELGPSAGLPNHWTTREFPKFNFKFLQSLKSQTVLRASLVAQWLRIRLPMQGTQLQALVREDLTCRGTTKPVQHDYWACALEPASHNYRAREPQLLSPHATTTEARMPRAQAPQQEKPPQWEAHAPQRRVAPAHCN